MVISDAVNQFRNVAVLPARPLIFGGSIWKQQHHH